jgi:hypothetical protein
MSLKYIDIINHLGMYWVINRLVLVLKNKTGWFKVRTPNKNWSINSPEFKGEFFNACLPVTDSVFSIERSNDILNGIFRFFSSIDIQTGFPPNWHSNPFFDLRLKGEDGLKALKTGHWSRILDFSFGDIKGIWELGRFTWVYPLLQAYHKTKDEKYAEAVWELIADWARHNSPNKGVHWKCGQEIAIRMFGVLTSFFSLRESRSTGPEEKKMAEIIVYESAKRINGNIGYALSQKNNHGISESAGLFTAGVLFKNKKWLRKGKQLLEKQAKELIYGDGSFSQHSTNYHRLMLDVFLWVISLGKANGIEFSKETISRVRVAGLWLFNIIDPVSGRCPNLGSNDGALLFPITECDYFDYRPIIQALGAVLDGKSWIDNGPWDNLANWFEPNLKPHNHSTVQRPDYFQFYNYGGYALWQDETTKVMFRCPEKFKHRPSQCDLFHIDVFHKGVNLLRDGGTYSYNCDEPWQSYFSSVTSHNTIQFDDHDQMPRISRFLYGRWPQIVLYLSGISQYPSVETNYTDHMGCKHDRKIEFESGKILVYDQISSFNKKAVLRWRLAPEIEWTLNEWVCSSRLCKIKVRVDEGITSLAISEGWESLYYFQKNKVPVLEVTVSPVCSLLITEIQFLEKYSI